MYKVKLFRTQQFKGCTRGLLVIAEAMKLYYTLEPPWKDNKSNISCIPTGTYICKWHKSPKYGWVYLVTGTQSRKFILIHSGNVARHTKGCILLGSRFGTLYNQPAVLSSKPAIRDFFDVMKGKDFELEIL